MAVLHPRDRSEGVGGCQMLFFQDDEKGSINEGYEIWRVQNTREQIEILTVMSALAHPRSERAITNR
jgi:hypothetical protein